MQVSQKTPSETVAYLRETYLLGANLSKTLLSRANLFKANLSYANLSEAYLGDEQINMAFGNENTKLPEHLQRPAHWSKDSEETPAEDDGGEKR